MSTQHTPGELTFRRATRPDNTGGYDYAIVDAENKIIAETFAHVDYATGATSVYEERPAESNARLFAAAPDLYEALQRVKNWSNEHDFLPLRLVLAINTALAKAEGR